MNALITSALETNQISFLFKIPTELLNTIEQGYYKSIREYVLKYGTAPTLDRFKLDHPYFVPMLTADPIEDVFQRELKAKKSTYFKELIMRHRAELEDGADPTELVAKMHKVFSNTDHRILSTRDLDRSIYFEKRKMFTYGVDFIDKSTGGISGGDLVWIVGRPGSNKTTFAEWMMINWAYTGLRILYISNENSAYEALPKIDAFYGGWNPIKMRTGDWSEEDRARIKAAAHIAEYFGDFIVIPSAPALTTDEVNALINELNPDVVVIDGVYLMSDSKRAIINWEDAAAVSRNLKRTARKLMIPIIGVIQANREAEGAMVGRNTIAHTDAYLSDADTIIALNKNSKTVVGQVIKSRWGPTMLDQSFEFSFDFTTMSAYFNFEKIAEISDEDW